MPWLIHSAARPFPFAAAALGCKWAAHLSYVAAKDIVSRVLFLIFIVVFPRKGDKVI